MTAISPGGPVARTFRRGRRRVGSLLRRPAVDFVYSLRYQLELPGLLYDPRRGEQILAFLDSTGLLGRRAVHAPLPATFRQLRRVHSDNYLDSLNLPGALTRIAGVTLPESLSDRALTAQRFMVGGTLRAAALAVESGGIAVNLGGGLHHAFAGRGERFCIYNDVATAIAELREDGFAGRILVVDLDVHDGDGTRTIFAQDSSVHTFSIHNRTSTDEPAVEATVIELGFGIGDSTYLDAVRSSLPPVFAAFQPALVFYLAGADPAADDQIGDWKISAAGLLERDRFVLDCARGTRRLPLIIALAGGYGLNAWRYSARFFSGLLNRGKPLEPPSTEEALLVRYRRLAQDLEPHELTGEPRKSNDWGLTDDDILSSLGGAHRPRRFLGYYSPQGLELALERAGLLDRVRALGFVNPVMEMDLDNPTGDTVRLYGDVHRRELLIEARARIDRGALRVSRCCASSGCCYKIRGPSSPPTGRACPARPSGPRNVAGHRRPADPCLRPPAARWPRLRASPLPLRLAEPEVAALSRSRRRGRFPIAQQALHGLPLSEAARAVTEMRVVDVITGEPFLWRPMPMGLPVTTASLPWWTARSIGSG